jgi:HTH-type transcriptional regulator, transcriptional repressor of NAD biosynthesis genes
VVKRVAIFGAESTGKSTLAAQLAAHFGEPWVPEYVREFWDAHQGVITAADLGAIARMQMETEDAAAKRAQAFLFCDTDLLTNVLWADLLYDGNCPPWMREQAEMRSRDYALYLLCDTDIAFTPDPQRSFPDPAGRAMCRRLWRETLVSRHLPFVEISGPPGERLRAAIAAVEALG